MKKIIHFIFNSGEEEEYYGRFSEDSLVTLDDGDYQGTLIFLFHLDTYQPNESDYVVSKVSYGSCSYCDTMQSIWYSYDDNTEEFVSGLMLLALHLIQSARYLYSEDDY